MTISRSQIAKELVPGLNKVLGMSYKAVTEEHLPMYQIETSNRAFEEMVMMSGLGAAPTKGEGAAIQYDDMQETYTATFRHETTALGFAITKEAFDDNLYDTFSKARAQALGRSMAHTKQVKAAALFNNGFSTSYPIGDGAAFFSAAHPTSSGNQNNTASTDFSESTLESALIAISQFKDDRGILIGAKAQKLIVPADLSFTVPKVLHTSQTTTTATNSGGITNLNDINAVNYLSAVPGGYAVNRYLTDADAWFIRTDVPNGAIMFVRQKLESDAEGDFDTGNMRYKATERFSFGVGDWRGYWGSQGA